MLRGPATFGMFVTASSLAWHAKPDDPAARDGSGATAGTRVTLERAAVGDLVALLGPVAE